MKREEFNKLIDSTFLQCKDVMLRKGNDYANNDDILANFKTGAQRLQLQPEQVWAVYFMKHIDAILTYIRVGYLASEPIEGRIQDAINYLLLLQAMVTENSDKYSKD